MSKLLPKGWDHKKKKNIMILVISLIAAGTCAAVWMLIGRTKLTPPGEAVETSWSGDSVAEHTVKGTPAPAGMELVTDPAKFRPVTKDQSYQFETDQQNCFAAGGLTMMASDGNSIYMLLNGYLHVFDKKTKEFAKLCNKPECKHEGKECNAYISGEQGFMQGLFYYQGNLYSLTSELSNTGKAETSNAYEAIFLYQISTDGSKHKKVCELTKVIRSGGSETMSAYIISCFQHRGYLYYLYSMQLNDNDHYQNGSNIIWRISLDGDQDRECVMPLPEYNEIGQARMLSAGSYVYFMIPDQSGEGELYRFNSEAKQVEKLNLPKLFILDFDLKDGKVLYKENTTQAILREYDPTTGKNQVWADLTDLQMQEAWGVSYDQGYVYVYHFDEASPREPDKRYMQIAPDGTVTREISLKQINALCLEKGVFGDGRGPCEGFFFEFVNSADLNEVYYLEIDQADGENTEFIKAK